MSNKEKEIEDVLRTAVKRRVGKEEHAFRIVEKMVLAASVEREYLLHAAKFITVSQYKDVVEERAITKLCGYPLCNNRLTQVLKQKYKISLKEKKVYDITERKNFCSNKCYKSSKFLESQLSAEPVWVRNDEPDVQLVLFEDNKDFNKQFPGSGEEININKNIEVYLNEKIDRESKLRSKGSTENITSDEKVVHCNEGIGSDDCRYDDHETDKIDQVCSGVEEICIGDDVIDGDDDIDDNDYRYDDNNCNVDVDNTDGVIQLDSDYLEIVDLPEQVGFKIIDDQSSAINDLHGPDDIDSGDYIDSDDDEIYNSGCHGNFNNKMTSRLKDPKHEQTTSRREEIEKFKNSSTLVQKNDSINEIRQVGRNCPMKENKVQKRSISDKLFMVDKSEKIKEQGQGKTKKELETVKNCNKKHCEVFGVEKDCKTSFRSQEFCLVGDVKEKDKVSGEDHVETVYKTLCEWCTSETWAYCVRSMDTLEDNKNGAPDLQSEEVGGKITKMFPVRKKISIPSIDSKSPMAIRGKIVSEKLFKALYPIISKLGLAFNDISSAMTNILKTFRFSSSNIVLKPLEWTLVGIVIIYTLKKCDVSVRTLLSSRQDILSSLLSDADLTERQLERLVGVFTREGMTSSSRSTPTKSWDFNMEELD